MNETSLKAYWSERLSGRVSMRQVMVLDSLNIAGPATRAALAERLNIPLSSVCGRVNELLDQKVIEEFVQVQDERTLKKVWMLRIKETV